MQRARARNGRDSLQLSWPGLACKLCQAVQPPPVARPLSHPQDDYDSSAGEVPQLPLLPRLRALALLRVDGMTFGSLSLPSEWLLRQVRVLRVLEGILCPWC